MIKGTELENRGPAAAADPKTTRSQELKDKGAPIPPAAPVSLAARLAAARALTPPKTVHCGHCWGVGREDVLRAIEQEDPEARA